LSILHEKVLPVICCQLKQTRQQMNKIITLISILILNIPLSAQTINNFSFENWTSGNPDSWATYSVIDPLLSSLYLQETTATDGSSSISLTTTLITVPALSTNPLLINPGLVYGSIQFNTATFAITTKGKPFTFRPDSIKFDIRFDPAVGGDTAIFGITFTKNSTLIGGIGPSANNLGYTTGTNNNWNDFTYPITYLNSVNPDSVLIIISSAYQTPVNGSKLYVDNIRLIYNTSSGVMEEYPGSNMVHTYPNPAYTEINFKVNEKLKGGIIEIYNMNGEKIYVEDINQELQKFQLNHLNNGSYIYRVIKDNTIHSGNFIIQN